jgi:hypothetical protein
LGQSWEMWCPGISSCKLDQEACVRHLWSACKTNKNRIECVSIEVKNNNGSCWPIVVTISGEPLRYAFGPKSIA